VGERVFSLPWIDLSYQGRSNPANLVRPLFFLAGSIGLEERSMQF
jgi:hypothetical protein